MPIPEDRLLMIKLVIGEISKYHVAPDRFVEAVRGQIAGLQAFVREKDLVDQDPTRPLIVRETPVYMRGIAGASHPRATSLNRLLIREPMGTSRASWASMFAKKK